MMQYDKIDGLEGIDVNKTSALKKCRLCHYWFLKDIGFKCKENICYWCNYLLTESTSLKDIAILSAKGHNFRCILMGISKNKASKPLNNSVTHDRGVL